MMAWAMYYAKDMGLSIIPVQGKTPLVPWKVYQTRRANEEEIKNWWTKWPEADIGCVTGSITDRLILDIDGAEGIKSISGMVIPPTKSVRTKRGIQYHFRNVSEVTKTTIAGLMPQVDVRGEGGYVKLPPSLFSDGSGRYEWVGDTTEVAECPQWLIDLLTKREVKSEVISKSQGWIAEVLNNLTDGSKHQQIVSILGRLRHDNYAKEDAFAFVMPYAREKGVSEQDIWDRINSVWSLYQGKPIISIPETSEPFVFKTDVNEYLQDLQERAKKFEPEFPTGFPSLDRLTKGFPRQNVYVIGAPTNGGKTQFVLSNILTLLKKGKKVLYFSTEMPQKEIRDRFNALGAGIPIDELTSGFLRHENKEKLVTFLKTFDSSGFIVSPEDRPTLENIANGLDRVKPDIIFVDHIHHIRMKTDNRRTEIDDFVMGFKKLILDHNIPGVVTAQLRRKESIDGKPIHYTMHDFKESGGIENEAGVCLLLCPPEEWTNERIQHVTGYIPKNRHGKREVRFSLEFDTDIARFSELERN